MNRNIIVALVAILALAGGAYFYINSQNTNNTPQHGGGHSTETDNQSVAQSHRSYSMDITRETPNKVPDQPVNLTYTIKNDRGEVLKDFETVHESKMHFIVVREDLLHFQHLHPKFNQNSGEWTIDITFPTDGSYRVFPDFTPAKSADNPMLLPVTVNSRVEVGDIRKYKAQAAIPDTQQKKTFGDYQVTHTLPTNLRKQQEVTYSLTIEKNGQPVTDLQQYLGAMGHSVILKEGTLDFIHTHAGEATPQGIEHGARMHTTSSTGPNIDFTTTFLDSGVYKIFTQFKHDGEVQTVDYTVKVD
jgi:hypothetical protein